MIFSGGSTFATDFQQVIDRAVAIAALPLVQLRNQRAVLANQTTALDQIGERLASLQTSIETVNSAIPTGLHSATVADESVARVTLGANVLAADYSLEVVSLGSRTLTLNLDGLPPVGDPFTESISSATDFTLTVDGVAQSITPLGGSLFDLATAINAAGGGVQATVVNVGNSSSPDYRLSIQGEKYAGTSIQLNDGTQDLLETLATGTSVSYRINGIPVEAISSDTRKIILSPGLTVDLLGVGTTDIVVSKNAGNIADALATFVSAYNAGVEDLDTHRGPSAGALNGQSIVSTLARSLATISGYSADTGDIRSLADLGISLNERGLLSLDRTALESRSIDDVLSFLGDSTVTGFLKAAADVAHSLGDSDSGLLELERASLDRRLETQDRLIASNEDRIELMRENLTSRMIAADAVIAVLEQQVLGINTLFEALRASRESLK